MEPAWNYEIFVATYADEPYGVDPVNITNHAGADGAPSWSPDGARLVFTRDGDLATMNADGSGLAVLDDAQHVQSLRGHPTGRNWSMSVILTNLSIEERSASSIPTGLVRRV